MKLISSIDMMLIKVTMRKLNQACI